MSNVEILAKVLSSIMEKGSISYEEIALPDDVKVSLLLLLVKERLLISLQTSRALAWEDRMLTFKDRERYEMPHVIRNLVRNAKKTENCLPIAL